MEVIQIPVGRMGNLAYIAYSPESGQAAIIDPAWEADKISGIIRQKNLDLRAILLTHGHFDHSNAVPALLEQFPGTPAYMRAEDKMLPEQPFEFISPEGERTIKGFPEISMLRTPGHTGGSVCWLLPGIIFTGDTLFTGACGRIDFPESVPGKMYGTFQTLLRLPGNTVMYPGHAYGGSESTMEREQRGNPYMRAAASMPEEEFLQMLL